MLLCFVSSRRRRVSALSFAISRRARRAYVKLCGVLLLVLLYWVMLVLFILLVLLFIVWRCFVFFVCCC